MENFTQSENKYLKKIAFTTGFLVGVALCLVFTLIVLITMPC